jgi:hypothetical protein
MTKEENRKALLIRIPEDLHTRPKVKVAQEKTDINTIATKLLEGYIKGKIKI